MRPNHLITFLRSKGKFVTFNINTTCIAISFGIPNKLAARGISNSEPPATPQAPQALIVANTLRSNDVAISTSMPSVLIAARVITLMVTAAPAILMVAPNGMDKVYQIRS